MIRHNNESAVLMAAKNIHNVSKLPATVILEALYYAGQIEENFNRIYIIMTTGSYVYVYRDRSGVILYVGKGSGTRILNHSRDTSSAIYGLDDLIPEIIVSCLSNEDACEIERYLIDVNRINTLNRISGTIPSENDNKRQIISALIMNFDDLVAGLPWNNRTKIRDISALKSLLLSAFKCGKTHGITYSGRSLANDIGITRPTASKALRTLCDLGTIEQSRRGGFGYASQFNLSETLTTWHTLETPMFRSATDLDERFLLSSDAFRKNALGKGALQVYLYAARRAGVSITPRDINNDLNLNRASIYRWIQRLVDSNLLVVANNRGTYRSVHPHHALLESVAKYYNTHGRGLFYHKKYFAERMEYDIHLLYKYGYNGFNTLVKLLIEEYHQILDTTSIIN